KICREIQRFFWRSPEPRSTITGADSSLRWQAGGEIMGASQFSALFVKGVSRRRHSSQRLLIAAGLLLMLAANATVARAVTSTWSASAATGAWQTTANWTNGVPPGATSGTTNTDTAQFITASSTTLIVPD